jgi:hypothetical protein
LVREMQEGQSGAAGFIVQCVPARGVGGRTVR